MESTFVECTLKKERYATQHIFWFCVYRSTIHNNMPVYIISAYMILYDVKIQKRAIDRIKEIELDNLVIIITTILYLFH